VVEPRSALYCSCFLCWLWWVPTDVGGTDDFVHGLITYTVGEIYIFPRQQFGNVPVPLLYVCMALPCDLMDVVLVHKDTALVTCKAVDVDVDAMDF
jgi:hypothetical protein